MKIVFTDSKIIDQGDIDWSPIEDCGEFINFKDLGRQEALKVLANAEAVFIDGFEIDREIMEAAGELRFIGAAATGYNNVDVDFARERGIALCNVPAYSTEAVAQHAVALLLTLSNRIGGYDNQIKSGLWNSETGENYEFLPITLLDGKSIGIVGYGNIGKRVAGIAQALGMEVNIYSRDPEAAAGSDVVSLHCPLTKDNAGMVDAAFIDRMKDGAILINTARGGLINSSHVAEALKSRKLAAYGTDVTSPEPPDPEDPLLSAPNCVITPHIAFTPRETRQKVVDICGANLKAFMEGGDLNRII